MSYQPVIAGAGLNAWRFLERTGERQEEVYRETGLVARETEYAREKLSQVRSADDLVNDRTLLKVALGAYGLDEDIDNRFFIKRVLDDGSENAEALSNRLADKRYLALSEGLGLGLDEPSRQFSPEKVEEIISLYQRRSFEQAVGEQNPDLRLALGIERDLGDLAAKSGGNDAKWFTIMGTRPLRAVFEKALNLPESFGTLPVDRQLEVFKERAEQFLGTSEISDFVDSEAQDDLRRRFLLNAQVAQGVTQSASSNALTLLQSAPSILPNPF